MTIDFQGLFRSAWIGRVSKAKYFVGLSDAREGATWFYHRVVHLPSGPLHAVERYMATANEAVRLYDPQAESVSANSLLGALPPGEPVQLGANVVGAGFVLLHPFARGQGKSLASDEIRKLCQVMSPRQVVLVGQHSGAPLSGLPRCCLDLSNQTTLAQLIWLLRQAAFVVTVDSGPAHLAAAMKRPMLAIHTWSDPRFVGPFWGEAWVWKNGSLLQMKGLSKMGTAIRRSKPARLQDEDLVKIGAVATSS